MVALPYPGWVRGKTPSQNMSCCIFVSITIRAQFLKNLISLAFNPRLLNFVNVFVISSEKIKITILIFAYTEEVKVEDLESARVMYKSQLAAWHVQTSTEWIYLRVDYSRRATKID